jgi:class 3 adenylate cyclase
MSAVASRLDGSVVFSDLVGFTEFNGARGDAAAVEVLDRHRALMDGALVGHDGARVVKELGDGLLVWCPTADDALHVVTDFLGRMSVARGAGEFPLAARLGVHHGPVSERGDDLVGQTVNIAARIVDLAGPSEILLSDAVLAASDDVADLAYHAVGPVTVKGVADAVWLYRIDGAA